MSVSRDSSQPEFRAGDNVRLAEGPYQGTTGVFMALTQDVKWAEIEEPKNRVRRHPVEWMRLAVLSILALALLAPSLGANDLSTYRDFRLGMNLPAVVKAVGSSSPRARVIHERPDLIQQLDWQQPERYPVTTLDPVKSILFSFCNGELFQMVVRYDRTKTEGLTSEDMIESISATYGTATRPDADIIFPSIYDESVKVIARWEDSEYSFNLVRSSYQPSFGMIAVSKRLDAVVRASIAEGIRLEAQEAPKKELDAKKKQQAGDTLALEKARTVNKPNFRP
jgi:hypothetical protein